METFIESSLEKELIRREVILKEQERMSIHNHPPDPEPELITDFSGCMSSVLICWKRRSINGQEDHSGIVHNSAKRGCCSSLAPLCCCSLLLFPVRCLGWHLLLCVFGPLHTSQMLRAPYRRPHRTAPKLQGRSRRYWLYCLVALGSIRLLGQFVCERQQLQFLKQSAARMPVILIRCCRETHCTALHTVSFKFIRWQNKALIAVCSPWSEKGIDSAVSLCITTLTQQAMLE